MATGIGTGAQNTEIVDLEDESFKCTVNQFPTSTYGATGGLISDTPFICGGFSGGWQKFCYFLQEYGDWKFESNLTTPRGYAANGNVIRNHKLVMAGGTDGWHLSTIEVVAPNAKSETLPIKLPMAMSGSCIVPWDTDTFMLIGGYSYMDRNQTYLINMANNTYTTGPDLLTARSNLGCHTMNVNGEDFIIVAGGAGATQSTEYLPKANYSSGWQKSKNRTVV